MRSFDQVRDSAKNRVISQRPKIHYCSLGKASYILQGLCFVLRFINWNASVLLQARFRIRTRSDRIRPLKGLGGGFTAREATGRDRGGPSEKLVRSSSAIR